MPSVRYILTDIEGTTTAVQFVHTVLFPYAAKHLEPFLREHAEAPAVRACIAATRAAVASEEGRVLLLSEVAAELQQWIRQDRKHPALKQLQGMIWRAGYESQAFKADVYPDVRPMLGEWHSAGISLGVYSSGSVEAQKLLFAHTEAGDLTPFFSHYFDTAVGSKTAAASYQNILKVLGLPAPAVLFLSDVVGELAAARAAGMRTTHIVRPGTAAGAGHPMANSFAAVDLDL